MMRIIFLSVFFIASPKAGLCQTAPDCPGTLTWTTASSGSGVSPKCVDDGSACKSAIEDAKSAALKHCVGTYWGGGSQYCPRECVLGPITVTGTSNCTNPNVGDCFCSGRCDVSCARTCTAPVIVPPSSKNYSN